MLGVAVVVVVAVESAWYGDGGVGDEDEGAVGVAVAAVRAGTSAGNWGKQQGLHQQLLQPRLQRQS